MHIGYGGGDGRILLVRMRKVRTAAAAFGGREGLVLANGEAE